ncbi:hypothetical protein ACLIMP_19185 [Novosphingobium aerophilum]|nr:hypothetical protein [Novosphingobium sp. RL4]KPH58094.1 hypothetical protein ADT71_26645 [Novosphingobium sp. ST904]TCM41460.1 hypothetical protein EDF59_103212 [Novosphingobium sp. ST904]WRT95391.1 hypothetical protein U9J33_24765 [Novosphingobium sp. RL4]
MSDTAAMRSAIRSGLAYLESVQLESGELPSFSAHSCDMIERRVSDPCVFVTAFIANVLAECPQAALIFERACSFLTREREAGGFFRYWKKGHHGQYVPLDVDDTALGAAALGKLGRQSDNRAVLLENRDPHGMFYTWIVPSRGRRHWRLIGRDWRQAFAPLRSRQLFASGRIERDDVDAGINANVLVWLGSFEGDDRVIDKLVEILRGGREPSCDRYYNDPFLILYMFSRALVGRSEEARSLILSRTSVSPEAPAIHVALAILVRSIWGAPIDEDWIDRLLLAQQPAGEWPIAPLYVASRERRGYLDFAPAPEKVWRVGSEAMTTALSVSALDRALAGREG